MSKFRLRTCAALASAALMVPGMNPFADEPTVDEIRASVAGHTAPATALFREFLALPNDARFPADIEALNAWMAGAFSDRGFDGVCVLVRRPCGDEQHARGRLQPT